jgi:DNA invertase Pin-like site-specific DNA recombinase
MQRQRPGWQWDTSGWRHVRKQVQGRRSTPRRPRSGPAAAALGIELVRVFEDAGESAHNARRPGLVALLAAVEAGEASVIVVPDLTRLARDLGDLRRLLAFLDGRGVRLVSATGGV